MKQFKLEPWASDETTLDRRLLGVDVGDGEIEICVLDLRDHIGGITSRPPWREVLTLSTKDARVLGQALIDGADYSEPRY